MAACPGGVQSAARAALHVHGAANLTKGALERAEKVIAWLQKLAL